MSQRRHNKSLPPELAERFDLLCDRFEPAWQAGGRPALEDFLAQIEEPARTALFVELFRLDMAYRLLAGEAPRVEAYLERFPALAREQRLPLELIAAEF